MKLSKFIARGVSEESRLLNDDVSVTFYVLEVVFSFSINWLHLLLGFFFHHLLCYYLSLRR